MFCMNQPRKGEFQEVEFGNYFTFGDLEDCPDSSLKVWTKEQPWYETSVDYSFIDIDTWRGIDDYRLAVIKDHKVYVRMMNALERYDEWEEWKIKNLVIYK